MDENVLYVPIRWHSDVETRAIVNERSVGLTQPVVNGPIVGAPQEVVHSVAVVITNADDMRVCRNHGVEVRAVIDERAVGLTEPVVHRPVIRAPQDVAVAIAVEVTGTDDVPVLETLVLRLPTLLTKEPFDWPSQSVTVP